MTNPHIRKLLYKVMEETKDEQKQKACLIEDIIKAQKLLFGMGEEMYRSVIENPTAMFDKLHDMTIDQLQINNALLEMKINKLMKSKITI